MLINTHVSATLWFVMVRCLNTCPFFAPRLKSIVVYLTSHLYLSLLFYTFSTFLDHSALEIFIMRMLFYALYNCPFPEGTRIQQDTFCQRIRHRSLPVNWSNLSKLHKLSHSIYAHPLQSHTQRLKSLSIEFLFFL
ncbi:unnamed protein product [Durusdinium trenchii]|uniref:Uncharacterized protein n=1 Tax=Durusdinium trenchii TaxID=1381693 RepID=A0ABP0QBT7_9DINO